MSSAERSTLDMALRGDLATFIHYTFNTVVPGQRYHHNWHIEAMAWFLQRCATGEVKRLLITVPPRYLKSISGSVGFVAWMLGRDPSARIICASYSAKLAGTLAQQCRVTMESEWYRRVFPQTRISREKNTEMNFETTRRGYRYSTSVGGTLTGRGGNILIIDDPLKADDALSEAGRSAVNDWYDGTLSTRLDDKRKGTIIIIAQRLHLDDLPGHVLQQEDWVRLDLPAIAEIDEEIAIGPKLVHFRKAGELLHPARESQAEIDQMKVKLSSFGFSAQYQQRPIPVEGEIVKWEWFRVYEVVPERQPGDEIVQSWDTAYRPGELNDYSVCTTWLVRGNQYFLVHILREKLNYPELKKKVIGHAQEFHADVVIVENKGSGMSLIDDLRQGGAAEVPMPIAFDPESDKVTRMSAQSAKIEAGQILLPRKAPWLADFQAELLQFPNGRHDDQVDSLSQFLGWVSKRSTFSCTWIDPRPTADELLSLTAYPGQVPLLAPAPTENVMMRDPRPGRSGLLPAKEYLEQMAILEHRSK